DNRTYAVLNNIGIGWKWARCRSIVENNILASPQHVANDGLGQHGGGSRGISLMDGDVISARGGLCHYLQFITSREDQQTSFSAGMLDARAHDSLDQFFQHHLACDRLGHLYYSREIQDFSRRHDRARRAAS